MDKTSRLVAALVPLAYLWLYTPLGMDSTDFGYFYGYAWRILQGQLPYRDFYYIKPAFPLYWHAFWMWLTPEKWQILAGKAGFLAEMLLSSWLGALFLARTCDLQKLKLPVPLLATAGFVFSVHTFPHMPWHTADGTLFCAIALFLAASNQALLAGVACALGALCKQSFLLVPLGAAIFIWLRFGRRKALLFALGAVCVFGAFFAWLAGQGAWDAFRTMTTGQLALSEALDAGFLIYVRQNWWLPGLALLPWLVFRMAKRPLPRCCLPGYCYLLCLAVWYVWRVASQRGWIGFGASWPTLFLLLGAICVIFPREFLAPYVRARRKTWLFCASALGLPLLVAWSCAISGGYKIPAFFATPLVFAFLLAHVRLGGSAARLAWATLLAGLVMFGAGYQYPYVFPERPLARADLVWDAGQVYARATGVKVDAGMLARLAELKALRERYGPKYKTLPGFTLAYYLNDDQPQVMSDWLIDWEINGDAAVLYDELLAKGITVFMERDQLAAEKADSYERARYTVPQMVRRNWRIVEETPHFVVFQPPANSVH